MKNQCLSRCCKPINWNTCFSSWRLSCIVSGVRCMTHCIVHYGVWCEVRGELCVLCIQRVCVLSYVCGCWKTISCRCVNHADRFSTCRMHGNPLTKQQATPVGIDFMVCEWWHNVRSGEAENGSSSADFLSQQLTWIAASRTWKCQSLTQYVDNLQSLLL